MRLSLTQINKQLSGTGYQISVDEDMKHTNSYVHILNEDEGFLAFASNIPSALIQIGCRIESQKVRDLLSGGDPDAVRNEYASTPDLIDEIQITCQCGHVYSVREGSIKERSDPKECLDEHGFIKSGTMFTCPRCDHRGISFGNPLKK